MPGMTVQEGSVTSVKWAVQGVQWIQQTVTWLSSESCRAINFLRGWNRNVCLCYCGKILPNLLKAQTSKSWNFWSLCRRGQGFKADSPCKLLPQLVKLHVFFHLCYSKWSFKQLQAKTGKMAASSCADDVWWIDITCLPGNESNEVKKLLFQVFGLNSVICLLAFAFCFHHVCHVAQSGTSDCYSLWLHAKFPVYCYHDLTVSIWRLKS